MESIRRTTRAFKTPWKYALRELDDIPKCCAILSDPVDAVIDIVFVHGFGGHCTDTWTSEDVFWPRDFLKSKLERARIISFGYDTDISQFLPKDDNSVSPCAFELLTSLAKLRTDEFQRDRALIFVVHSIGSTVVKDALSYSPSCQLSALEDVTQACRGVVFLGAAHRETLRENFGQIAAKAAAVVQPSLKADVLHTLEERSSVFDAVNESFIKYLEKRGKTFKSITFYEKPRKGEVTVEHESARMDHRDHDLLGLTTDHCNMSKFIRLEDPNYMAISNVIKGFYEDIVKPRRPECQVLFDCPNALLDIIFVHSLGCSHTETWTNGTMHWPQELLPVDMPYARIIACHYQFDFATFMKPNQTVMQDLAIDILLSLLRIRSNLPPSRPLLFIAHSIGGTLIKQALNISHLSPEQAMHAISNATQGIIFLGTPHKSDGKRSVGKITAMAVRAGSPHLDDEVVEVIKRDPAFELFNNTFQEYLEKREYHVHVVSFYEQHHLSRTIVTKTCASLPTQRHLAKMRGSHTTLGRFQTQDDYKCIIKQIQAISGPRATGKGCNIVYDPPNAQIDIVFVPGLRRGVISTWTNEGLCWPRDLLQVEFPEARIILYGYNTDVSDFFSMKNDNSIFSCARSMLSDLDGIRGGDAQGRRILFIVHSTGGLLVKNVITQSQSGCDFGAVAVCLCGVIFLGTPHRWDNSDPEAISSLIKKLSNIGQSLPTEQPDSKQSTQILRSVTTSFNEIIREKGDDMGVWSFFEEKPMPDIGLVVDKFTAESDDAGYQVESIPATHIDMTKVLSDEDEGYRRLLGAIRQACNKVPSLERSRGTHSRMTRREIRRLKGYGYINLTGIVAIPGNGVPVNDRRTSKSRLTQLWSKPADGQ